MTLALVQMRLFSQAARPDMSKKTWRGPLSSYHLLNARNKTPAITSKLGLLWGMKMCCG